MAKQFPKNSFPRLQTLALSLFIHCLLGICITKIDFGTAMNSKTHTSIKIAFKLVEEKIIHYDKNANLKEYKKQDNSSISDNIISNSSATYGKTQNIEGNITLQQEKLLLASLNQMEDLVSQFNFSAQLLQQDSTGAFSPVQGLAPDTESLSLDLSNGLLRVTGFGRSVCTNKKGGLIR